jgi:uncharacterized membrane protein
VLRKIKPVVTFIAFILFWFLPSFVEAKSYSINKVDIYSTVYEDGSMKVKERRNYNFEGDYTFAYLYINKSGDRKEAYKFDNFEICEETDGCFKELNPKNKSEYDVERPKNSFYVEDQGNRYYIKWFYRASDENKKFILSYEIKNAVTLNQDTAEIYWKFIGKDWEISQSNIDIKVGLPANIPNNEIQAWGHGPLNAIVSIPDNRTVKFQAARLNPGTFLEGRILLPKSIFFKGVNDNSLNKDKIIEEENKFVADTEELKQDNRKKEIGGMIIILGLLAVGLVVFFKEVLIFKRYGKELKLPEVSLSGRLWEPPSKIDPAQIEQLISTQTTLSPKSFTATILSLIQNRYFKLIRSDQKEGLIFKKYHYYLIPQEKDTNEASSIETKVLNLLSFIGTKKEILGGQEVEATDLEEIVAWCQKDRRNSYQFFQEFQKLVFRENLEEGSDVRKIHVLILFGFVLFCFLPFA